MPETNTNRVLLNYLQSLGLKLNTDFLQSTLSILIDLIMEADVSAAIEAGYYERKGSRVAYRNGYRQRTWKTPLGDVPIRIPKLRSGSYYPDFIDKLTATHLLTLIENAYVTDPDPDDIRAVLDALHLHGIHASHITQIHDQLHLLIHKNRQWRIRSSYPYLWLDTLRLPGSRYGMAAVAVGMDSAGNYDLLAFEVGVNPNDEGFWRHFLRGLLKRGLDDVNLVISDAFEGVKRAVDDLMKEAMWQYSPSHFLQRVLDDLPEDAHAEIVDAISAVFVHADRQAAMLQLRTVSESLESRWPRAALTLTAYADHLLAYTTMPDDQWLWLAAADTMTRLKQALTGEYQPGGMLTDAATAMHLVADDFTSDFRANRAYGVVASHMTTIL